MTGLTHKRAPPSWIIFSNSAGLGWTDLHEIRFTWEDAGRCDYTCILSTSVLWKLVQAAVDWVNYRCEVCGLIYRINLIPLHQSETLSGFSLTSASPSSTLCEPVKVIITYVKAVCIYVFMLGIHVLFRGVFFLRLNKVFPWNYLWC